jgi:hypothetical protein
MRRTFLWINFVLSSAIVLLIFVQAYLIATWAIGNQSEEGVLDAHGVIGGLFIHGFELLVFLTAFGAWPRQWKWIGFTFGLFVLGTVQIFLLPSDSDEVVSSSAAWVHGLHGLFALFVLVYAAVIAHRGLRDLGLRRGHSVEHEGAVPPPPLP